MTPALARSVELALDPWGGGFTATFRVDPTTATRLIARAVNNELPAAHAMDWYLDEDGPTGEIAQGDSLWGYLKDDAGMAFELAGNGVIKIIGALDADDPEQCLDGTRPPTLDDFGLNNRLAVASAIRSLLI